ncbi:proline dehydrogenase family protein [Agilicoccus flavus]|uniref:proline dehydrogenase family protein n=1 Tax=Agilicoccus flavus TaxID=2775968 RepID=UPI001CF69EEB|nr:proline dehydrogenase family protein [Agilicoccus flavus]
MREVWSTTQDVLMRMAHDARLRRLIEGKSVGHDVVRRYVAGESISSALDVTGELLVRGRLVSLTHLAADPLDATQAKDRRKRLRKLLRRLGQAGYSEGARTEVSVRMRALGAGLRPGGAPAALEHARLVAQTAAEVGTRLTVETENTLPIDVTLGAWRELRGEFPDTGIALQAGLDRSADDCRALAADGARVRLGKGTAHGPGAITRPHDVDLAYVRCLKILLHGGADVVVATHDLRLLRIAESLVAHLPEAERAGREIEYGLRYGVAPVTQTTVADRGDRMRVYVPFGEDWYPYLMSRIAEETNPVVSLVRAATAR